MPDWGAPLADAMIRIHREREAQRKAAGLGDALSQIELPDRNDPSKTIPLFTPQAKQWWLQEKAAGGARVEGAAEALRQVAPYMFQAQQAEPRTQVQAPGGQTYTVPQTTAYQAEVEAPERAARTAHAQEETTASKEKRIAEAAEPTVMMNIGGNDIRIPAGELIKHPEFTRDQTGKDLNNQIFATTGLSLSQVAQGWNKRIVNGQLVVDAPAIQQTLDQLTQKPVPKYNVDGTPAYEQVKNPLFDPKLKASDANSPTVTKTTQYQIPQEYTPDVLRLLGTEGVRGAEQIKIPPEKPSGTSRIVPGSVQAPAKISSQDEYDALDSGTPFVGPDGKLRRKP